MNIIITDLIEFKQFSSILGLHWKLIFLPSEDNYLVIGTRVKVK